MKKLLLAIPMMFISSFAYAAVEFDNGISIGGSAELDYMLRHNNPLPSVGTDGVQKAGIAQSMEIATVINIDGRHANDWGYYIWRVAQKVATDGRYDKPGQREAWAGIETKLGTLTAGNMFSNLYLTMDGRSSAGSGNLFTDVGGHSVQYTRGLGYKTPTLGGLTFSTQYNIHSTGNINYLDVNDVAAPSKKNAYMYAYEVLVNYNNYGINADVGYNYNKNGKTNGNMVATEFGAQDRSFFDSNIKYPGSTETAYAAVTYNHESGAMVKVGYRHNTWKFDNILDISGNNHGTNTISDNMVLAQVGYTFGLNNITLGYVYASDINVVGEDKALNKKSGANQIHGQYTRMLSENVSAFVQARYQMLEDAKFTAMYGGFDGQAVNKKGSGRALVGFVASF